MRAIMSKRDWFCPLLAPIGKVLTPFGRPVADRDVCTVTCVPLLLSPFGRESGRRKGEKGCFLSSHERVVSDSRPMICELGFLCAFDWFCVGPHAYIKTITTTTTTLHI